ncbi:MAG: dTDP-4-dehydrorhamnose reductase [Bacteroidales bacterium]|nr:dTDP-4-dehydrorhamnose reductase [Bacteroidales bacterium]
MEKVLVTGAFGQLGSELRLLTEGNPGFIYTDIREEGPVRRLDICDPVAVASMLGEEDIRVILNCAAYTDVNLAESQQELCTKINAGGPAVLARAARRRNAALIHISTEYVFDGRKSEGYVENDRRHPLSAYGRSKRDGEDRIRRSGCRGLIIRTSWLYSPFGKNFVKTMLRLGAERPEVGVVRDQVGSPTYARDLAVAILDIMPRIGERRGEIYHFTNGGVCSWADFAAAVMREAGLPCTVRPITTAEYPTPAVRPAVSTMSKEKIQKDFGIRITPWEDSLRDCLRRLGK